MAGLVRRQEALAGALVSLPTTCAVLVPGAFSADQCARWTRGIYAGHADWNEDFGGEQLSLGRAFYTHLEEDRSDEYFDDPAASDAVVEGWAPGLQAAMRDLVAKATGARVVPRGDWCGPGVHIFPPGEPVARSGGVSRADQRDGARRGARRRAMGDLVLSTSAALSRSAAGNLGGGHVFWGT